MSFQPRAKARGCVALLVLLLFAPLPASAQPGGAIAYGQTVSGRITDEAFRVVYTFTGAQGEIIDAQMASTGGDLDPVLILLDADNAVLAHDDDGGSGVEDDRFGARLSAVPLPRDGLYFLVAARFGQDRGITEGDFTLRLNRVGVVSDPRLESGAILLRLGESVVRQLDSARPQDIFTFTALRGDLVSVTVSRISGDLDPVLILADRQGNTLLISDDDPQQPGTLNAAIRDWRVPRSGNYLVAAMRFGGESGSSRGSYTLTLERAAPDTLGGSAERAIWLEEGEVASGRIDGEQVQRFYALQANAGDVLAVEATRTGGNLDPTLELRGEDGRLLARHDGGRRGRNALITAYTVPLDGVYIVVVSRFNGDEGRTEGEYTLRYTRTE